MRWRTSHRFDRAALPLADRHYNRQRPGTPQFMPPGSCVVFLIPGCAVWGTSWPLPEYVKHRWPGAWVNSLFRNERPDLYLSSELIREACAATRAIYGDPPEPFGMLTFVDERKVRAKRDPGRCYLRAGFAPDGRSKDGKLAFLLRPDCFPPAENPIGWQASLFSGVGA